MTGRSNNDQLMWKRSSAKEMFQTQRMWPTFAGAKADLSKDVTGLLPVYVWPEQAIYLHNHPKVASTTQSKKRKLDDAVETNEPDGEDKDGQQKKRLKTNFFTDSVVVPVQQLYKSVKSAISSTFGWLFSRNTTNNDNADQSGADENTVKMEIELVKTEPEELHAPTNTPATTPSIAHLPYNERVKYTVFKALQDQAYFIGPGDVYGGDYSMYKGGDPSQTHSTGIVRVLQSNMVSAKEILAFSRVQNQVAKSSVFAYVTSSTTNNTDDNSQQQEQQQKQEQKGTDQEVSENNSSNNDDIGNILIESSEVVVPKNEEVLTAHFLVINFKSVSDRTN